MGLDIGAGRSMTSSSSSSSSCNKAVGNTINDVQRTRTRKYPITSTESRKQVAVDVCAQSNLAMIAIVKVTAVVTVVPDISSMLIAVMHSFLWSVAPAGRQDFHCHYHRHQRLGF